VFIVLHPEITHARGKIQKVTLKNPFFLILVPLLRRGV